MLTVFDNEMRCLFCHEPVRTMPNFAGYHCDGEEDGCGTYYFVSGVAQSESVPEWYVADGEVEIMQELNNGVTWHWCRFHQDYEPDTGFVPRPCGAHIIEMTALLSG